MTKTVQIETHKRIELIDITEKIRKIVAESGIQEGVCWIFVPHTTAGITINENADPSVRHDIERQLTKLIPYDSNYSHLEGNADAHIKSTVTNINTHCFVENGNILLGTWQGIFFCEYDGPRSRNIIIKITKG